MLWWGREVTGFCMATRNDVWIHSAFVLSQWVSLLVGLHCVLSVCGGIVSYSVMWCVLVWYSVGVMAVWVGKA